MPLRLFGDRRRSGAYAARALYLGAMMGFFFFTTQLMQSVFGFSAFQAGLGFLPMTAVNFAVATAFPRLARRYGEAPLLIAGVGLTLVGMGWLAQVDASSSYLAAVALPMVLIGAGQGLAFAPLTNFGLAGVRAEDAGAASGLVNTAHQLGMATGLAILVAASADAGDLSAQVATALAVGHRSAGAVPARRRGRHRPRATARAAEPVAGRSQGGDAMSRSGPPPLGNHPLTTKHVTPEENKKCEQRSSTAPATSASRTSPTPSSRRPPTPWCGSPPPASAAATSTPTAPCPPPTGRPASATSSSASSRTPAPTSPPSRRATSSSLRSPTPTAPASSAVRACRPPACTAASGPAGDIDGGQGEAARVPLADGTLVKLPVAADSALIPSLLTLSDVFGTGYHAAVRAGVKPGDTVTVIGDGAVGLLAVLSAKRLGAEQIILMGRHKARTDLGREFGATDVVAERGEEGHREGPRAHRRPRRRRSSSRPSATCPPTSRPSASSAPAA